jgi:hypothetical protein
VLVNSTVAPFVPRLLHETLVEDIASSLTGLMLPPLLMSSSVLPWMQAQRGGVIVNIASDAGKVATPGESVIGAAMAGIVMFSRALAMEAKRDGVRVNVLTPSLIEGTLTYERVTGDGFSARLFEKAAGLAHLGVMQPDDLAHLILYWASPLAARITGQATPLVEIVFISVRCCPPVLLTRPSMSPCVASTTSIVAITAASSRMSQTCVLAPPPSSAISAFTASRLSAVRPISATCAPSAASSCAVMPLPPPVTIIV